MFNPPYFFLKNTLSFANWKRLNANCSEKELTRPRFELGISRVKHGRVDHYTTESAFRRLCSHGLHQDNLQWYLKPLLSA